jgi:hypothetical protein
MRGKSHEESRYFHCNSCINEAENVGPMYETLKSAMEDAGYTWETAFDHGCTEAHKGIAKEISFSQGAVFSCTPKPFTRN